MIWNKKSVVFEVMVKLKMKYRSEIWWANKCQVAKLKTIQNDILRLAYGYIRKDGMHVDDLRMKVAI